VRRIPDKPGMAAKIFTALSDAHIVVDVIVQNISKKDRTDITFTVGKMDAKKACKIMEETAEKVGAEGVIIDEDIAKVSIVGSGMMSHAGIASKMFSVLAKEGINIEAITTSEIKLSCVIASKYGQLAVQTLHTAFGLDREDVEEEQ
ncbi:MAG TPA: aspartate kinase, partial [Syntrophorhabdus aromaticivorans]|nr:aspartate kinase [Syntrophorhabdus aromaticivorans]